MRTPIQLLVLLALTVSAPAFALSTAFQTPQNADWGGWTRGAAGTIFAGWEEFDSFVPVGFPVALPDSTPDKGSSGAKQAVLIPNNGGAFVTGSGAGGSIYSFSDINDFDVILLPKTNQPLGPVTVALQVSVVGTDLNHNTIKLNGHKWAERRTLATGTSSAPGGSGGSGSGVDNEYLYLWFDVPRVLAAEPYAFDLRAAGTSNSLDALYVDIGTAPMRPPSPPVPTPLPAGGWLLLSGLVALSRARRLV